MLTLIRLPVIAFLATALLGCTYSANNLPDLAAVSGVITFNGKPLSDATVSFESENGQIAFGKTDAEGRYELHYRDGANGAEIGTNTVRVESLITAPPGPNYRDPIPPKYNTRSTLTVEVTSGANTHNFDLSSKR
ncbi:MAG: carboxypeptidase regulatory-like domain-containing protein [Blastopirellula sp. JB062]